MSDTTIGPIVIQDQPMPLITNGQDSSQPTTTPTTVSSIEASNISPTTTQNVAMPTSTTPTDVAGTSIDTMARRILGTFSFGVVGALQIGQFEQGISGQIKISPNGIVAEDDTGTTTFAIDGITGNATFKGTVQAGSLISGNLVLGGVGNGSGTLTIKDASGNLLITEDNTGITFYQQTALQLSDPNFGNYAYFGPQPGSSNVFLETALGIGMTFSMNGTATFQMGAFQQGTLQINGSLAVAQSFSVGGTPKTAIVPVEEGEDNISYRALYTNESPELWFMDFADNIESIDPLFMKVTEGEMKIIECKDGSIQVWRRRKYYEKERFTPKTYDEFMRNNEFWETPRLQKLLI